MDAETIVASCDHWSGDAACGACIARALRPIYVLTPTQMADPELRAALGGHPVVSEPLPTLIELIEPSPRYVTTMIEAERKRVDVIVTAVFASEFAKYEAAHHNDESAMEAIYGHSQSVLEDLLVALRADAKRA